MAVESPRLKSAFVAQGIPPEKMVVTGKPSVDQIAKIIHNVTLKDLKEHYGIPPDRFVILCAVPQLGEHGILPWSEHWREIEFLFESLARQKTATIVLSLHPKSKIADYRSLADKFGAILATHRIYELIPVCDLFVSTYSSTVVQAIGLGKPAVVVDFYNLNYTFYDQEPGIVVVRERTLLVPLIEKLLKEPAYYASLAEAQKQRAPEWIILDGGCTQRVVDNIYRLIQEED